MRTEINHVSIEDEINSAIQYITYAMAEENIDIDLYDIINMVYTSFLHNINDEDINITFKFNVNTVFSVKIIRNKITDVVEPYIMQTLPMIYRRAYNYDKKSKDVDQSNDNVSDFIIIDYSFEEIGMLSTILVADICEPTIIMTTLSDISTYCSRVLLYYKTYTFKNMKDLILDTLNKDGNVPIKTIHNFTNCRPGIIDAAYQDINKKMDYMIDDCKDDDIDDDIIFTIDVDDIEDEAIKLINGELGDTDVDIAYSSENPNMRISLICTYLNDIYYRVYKNPSTYEDILTSVDDVVESLSKAMDVLIKYIDEI